MWPLATVTWGKNQGGEALHVYSMSGSQPQEKESDRERKRPCFLPRRYSNAGRSSIDMEQDREIKLEDWIPQRRLSQKPSEAWVPGNLLESYSKVVFPEEWLQDPFLVTTGYQGSFDFPSEMSTVIEILGKYNWLSKYVSGEHGMKNWWQTSHLPRILRKHAHICSAITSLGYVPWAYQWSNC